MTEMTPDNVVDYVDSFASEVILLLLRHASLPEKYWEIIVTLQ